jgi:Ca2+-binding RTX toxin-like protein
MAKMKLIPLIPDGKFLAELFTYELDLGRHTKTKAAFDGSGANQGSVVFTGNDLHYKAGALVGGTITHITFENAQGDDYATISGLHLTLPGKVKMLDGIIDLFESALKGADTIMGSSELDLMAGGRGSDELIGLNGNDRMDGGPGNDTYTGKLGSDTFFCGHGYGKDVVTDFDAVGGGLQQDYLFDVSAHVYTIRQRGSDTIVDFGDGHKVTLLDVAATDVSRDDIGPFDL